jgi:hypothetical protein
MSSEAITSNHGRPRPHPPVGADSRFGIHGHARPARFGKTTRISSWSPSSSKQNECVAGPALFRNRSCRSAKIARTCCWSPMGWGAPGRRRRECHCGGGESNNSRSIPSGGSFAAPTAGSAEGARAVPSGAERGGRQESSRRRLRIQSCKAWDDADDGVSTRRAALHRSRR